MRQCPVVDQIDRDFGIRRNSQLCLVKRDIQHCKVDGHWSTCGSPGIRSRFFRRGPGRRRLRRSRLSSHDDLAGHAALTVSRNRAVEFVLARRARVERHRPALSGGVVARVNVELVDIERMRQCSAVDEIDRDLGVRRNSYFRLVERDIQHCKVDGHWSAGGSPSIRSRFFRRGPGRRRLRLGGGVYNSDLANHSAFTVTRYRAEVLVFGRGSRIECDRASLPGGIIPRLNTELINVEVMRERSVVDEIDRDLGVRRNSQLGDIEQDIQHDDIERRLSARIARCRSLAGA